MVSYLESRVTIALRNENRETVNCVRVPYQSVGVSLTQSMKGRGGGTVNCRAAAAAEAGNGRAVQVTYILKFKQNYLYAKYCCILVSILIEKIPYTVKFHCHINYQFHIYRPSYIDGSVCPNNSCPVCTDRPVISLTGHMHGI